MPDVVHKVKVFAAGTGFSLALAFPLISGMTLAFHAASPLPIRAAAADPAARTATRQLFDLLNGERITAGLAPLVWDDQLATSAHKHTQLMEKHRQLSHQFPGEPPLRQRLAAVPLDRSGENVAMAGDVHDVHQALMQSPPHRANILSPKYNAVGIGVVPAGSNLWVTQDFALRIEEASQQIAAEKVANAFARTRRGAGLPPLERTITSRVSSLACTMARRDRLDTSEAAALPESRHAVAYTSLDLDQLPKDALSLARIRDVNRFAVGACFARSPSYPSGAYWVLLVLFAK